MAHYCLSETGSSTKIASIITAAITQIIPNHSESTAEAHV